MSLAASFCFFVQFSVCSYFPVQADQGSNDRLLIHEMRSLGFLECANVLVIL